ncbi:MAG: GNAT family N-acetyltransferase [Gemmatimonadota bacterium]
MSERRSIVSVSPSLLGAACAVVERALRDTHYLGGALDALRSAVAAPGADGRALACTRGDDVEGVIVFGLFGGASGAGRLHFVVVERNARRAAVARALVDAAVHALMASGARFMLAELPDDASELPMARTFLRALGFFEESRVDDFYRDGVALSFQRRELDVRA